MTNRSLTERVQDAAAEIIAVAVGGATGYYTGRKIDPAGGGATLGAAVGGVVASTAAKDFVQAALKKLTQPNPSDEAIRSMLNELYGSQRALHQAVESARSGH